jgi:hypothetical protein
MTTEDMIAIAIVGLAITAAKAIGLVLLFGLLCFGAAAHAQSHAQRHHRSNSRHRYRYRR